MGQVFRVLGLVASLDQAEADRPTRLVALLVERKGHAVVVLHPSLELTPTLFGEQPGPGLVPDTDQARGVTVIATLEVTRIGRDLAQLLLLQDGTRDAFGRTGFGRVPREERAGFHARQIVLDLHRVGRQRIGARSHVDRELQGLWRYPVPDHLGLVVQTIPARERGTARTEQAEQTHEQQNETLHDNLP